MNSRPLALEEGEISSDDLEDDEDDGLDDNLIGGEDDKRKLEKMSEKEREEELFKRGERRDAIQARRAVKLKLREKRLKERAQKTKSKHEPEKSVPNKKASNYANVFSSDSDDAVNSDFENGTGPTGIHQRKRALEERKKAQSHKFHELIQRRKMKAAKKRRLSGSDQDRRKNEYSSDSSSETEQVKSRGIKPSLSSDASDSSLCSRSRSPSRGRQESCSSSQHSDSCEDDTRGRSRSPEAQFVSSVEELSRIRLSRFKMEKWVHMPFFNDIVKGCFVRINIGLHQGVPIYRCAEIMDVSETSKVYDLGDTRTNKRIVVRVGKDQSTFSLAFVSNSDFQVSEFESWIRRLNDANMKPPTLAFVQQKSSAISDAINRPIRDERVVEQIIQSKRRFQKLPTNFALRKADLIKQRECAESESNNELLKRIDTELEEVESQAERIDRRRTSGFKSITSINQRNRALSVMQAEEAIRKESEEASKSNVEDPFTRVHSQPVIVTKKYLENLRHKRLNIASESTTNHTDQPATPSLRKNPDSILDASLIPLNDDDDVSLQNSASRTNHLLPHNSLHAIHNFEININLDLDNSTDDQNKSKEHKTNQSGNNRDSVDGQYSKQHHHKNELHKSMQDNNNHDSHASQRNSVSNNSMNNSMNNNNNISNNISISNNSVTNKLNRRSLNLQDYKKRHGLI